MEYYIGYIVCGFAVLIAILIMLFAQIKVESAYSKYKEVSSSLDLTGAQLAQKLADERGFDITIGRCSGRLSDHYDPVHKVLNISEENYNSKSLASQAIVAHEFGHALQDSEQYAPLKVRQFVIKTSNFISKLFLPMIIIGLIIELCFFAGAGAIIIYAYVGIYAIGVIASLVTLPVEYNASSRAKKLLLEMGCNSQEEIAGCDNVLNAAALTYVASLLVSVAYFLRLLFLLLTITRRD